VSTYLHGALSAHLPPLRLVSRAAQEYAGACPFCGGDERHSDRFYVWLLPAGRERYWCRRRNRKGPASELTNERQTRRPSQPPEPRRPRADGPNRRPEHIPHYRALYTIVTARAEENLHQPWNPEPLAYLRQRGFDLATIRWARLGLLPARPQPLVTYLERHAPRLLSYAEEAVARQLGAREDGAERVRREAMCRAWSAARTTCRCTIEREACPGPAEEGFLPSGPVHASR
jgi:hypothetical protein